jgi:hypothetical protein
MMVDLTLSDSEDEVIDIGKASSAALLQLYCVLLLHQVSCVHAVLSMNPKSRCNLNTIMVFTLV